MGVTYVKEVISPEELFERYPLPEAHKKLKAEKDKEIAKVFTGESDKFLVIVGSLVLPTTRMQYVITLHDLQKSRKRLQIN